MTRERIGGVAVETVGAGADLVLIHGVGSNRSIFSRVVPTLAEARRVSSLDLPGFGQSPAPEAPWTIASVADQIALALPERIEPPFDLLGSSLGGAIALSLASRHPQLIRRVVLQAPAGFRPLPGPMPAMLGAVVAPWLGFRRLAGSRLLGAGQGRRLALAGTVADASNLSARDARLILNASGGSTTLAEAFRAAAAANLTAELDRLQRPLALIWGDLDRVVPPIVAERILELRPDTPIERVAGCGHLPHVEAPERLIEAFERSLSQLP